MTAYLDSSVILGVLLGQKPAPPVWKDHQSLVASALVEVECLRTFDRLRAQGDLDDREFMKCCADFHEFLSSLNVIPFEAAVIRRAAGSFPGPLRSLDAIHLASAILWRDSQGGELMFLTHDKKLAQTAMALGFSVSGA